MIDFPEETRGGKLNLGPATPQQLAWVAASWHRFVEEGNLWDIEHGEEEGDLEAQRSFVRDAQEIETKLRRFRPLARQVRARTNPGPDENLRRLERAAQTDPLARAQLHREKRRRGLPSRSAWSGARKLWRLAQRAIRVPYGFDRFFQGYLDEAALDAYYDDPDDPNGPERAYDRWPRLLEARLWDPVTLDRMRREAEQFFRANQDDLTGLEGTWERAGSNLWHSRNGSGVGYWTDALDYRGPEYEEQRQALTRLQEAARRLGEGPMLWINDEGLVYG